MYHDRMIKRLIAAVCAMLLGGAMLAAEEKGTTFGTGVKLQTAVKVADLLAAPDQYLGKTVRVDGTVKAVCQNMGCWIQIADAPDGPAVQFKVDDGVIVFPKDAAGRRASAEGTFEAMPAEEDHEAGHATTPDQHAEHAKAAAQHAEHAKEAAQHAEHAKQPEAAKPAAAAEPPKYRVKATGAVIY